MRSGFDHRDVDLVRAQGEAIKPRGVDVITGDVWVGELISIGQVLVAADDAAAASGGGGADGRDGSGGDGGGGVAPASGERRAAVCRQRHESFVSSSLREVERAS